MADTMLRTHYEGCWRHEGHHACAVAKVERLQTEVKQLHRELHDERVRRDEWEKMYNQAIAGTEVERLLKTALDNEVDSRVSVELEVERLQAELARAHTIGTKMCGDLTIAGVRLGKDRQYSEGLEHRIEILNQLLDARCVALAEARDELAAVDEALGEFYCPVLDPETDKPCGSYWKDHGVNVMRQALDIALQAAQEQQEQIDEVETELYLTRDAAQEMSDEVQELWLSPAEAEGLKRQLSKMEAQIAAIKEAIEWLWGFWDGNSLRAIPGFEDDIREAWDKLLMAVDSIAGDALLQRLAETERCHQAALTMARNRGDRLEKAEGLAALVTLELARLLERLAQYWYQPEYDQAKDLAAKIRRTLSER